MHLIDKTGIFNLALLSLGQTAPVISADGDSTLTARILRQWFDRARSKTLEKTEWRCFRKTGALLLVNDKYSDSWEYRYKVPADCQQVLRVDFFNYFPNRDSLPANKMAYELYYDGSQQYILTNVMDAWASYTARPVDAAGVPDHYAEAEALVLAELAAPGLITNNWVKMKQAFLQDARQRISECIATDLGSQPERKAPQSSFADARRD